MKERGIISVCDSIWLGTNSIKLTRYGGELGGGELAMGRNRQLPFNLYKLPGKFVTGSVADSTGDPHFEIEKIYIHRSRAKRS